MTNDELKAIADRLDPHEFMQFLVGQPDVVQGIVMGDTDWALFPPAIREALQGIHRAQQEVLAGGGGTLTVTIDDDDGPHGYVAELSAP